MASPEDTVRVARRDALLQQLIHVSEQRRDARQQQQQLDARPSRAMQEPSRHARVTHNAVERYAALVQERRQQQERERGPPLYPLPSHREVLREANAVRDDVVGGETRQNAIASATARLEERRQQIEARRRRAQETYHPTQEQEAVASTALLPLLNHDADMVNEVLRLCWLYRESSTI